ncbi:MAG TPA: winged helix-turn-helix transcriptional regulator [Nitrospiria bacterium]|nr:winged helix-turn-helix transcriptional regulator [Nitrospiria bacterium]
MHLFRILDEVSKDGEVTQRGLSRRLGVALGLTNLYLKRLGQKGLIKVVNLKANRLRYELTPSGIAQKTTMAFQYVQDSYVFYREARKSLTKTFDGIKSDGARSVVLYGTGDLAEIALLSLQEAQLDVVEVVSARHVGQSLCGRPVRAPSSLAATAYDRIVVVERERDEVAAVLDRLGVNASTVTWVGAPTARS